MADESLPPQQQHHLRERASVEFKRFIIIFLYFGLSLRCYLSTRASPCYSIIWIIRSTPHKMINAFIFARSCLSVNIFA